MLRLGINDKELELFLLTQCNKFHCSYRRMYRSYWETCRQEKKL